MVTAAIIIIGNEILSGRTQDVNLRFLAEELGKIGVKLQRAVVIRDEEAEIIATVNACRATYDYVFTTGGIGPTHDDITTACIAKAFGVKVVRDAEAERRLHAHYPPEKRNTARMKMADVPEGAILITNPVSAAPGYQIENVFVLAGVPIIMQAMFFELKPRLTGGKPMQSQSLRLTVPEGDIAHHLTALQEAFPDVEIGCYPHMKDGMLGTSIVMRSEDEAQVQQVSEALQQLLLKDSVIITAIE